MKNRKCGIIMPQRASISSTEVAECLREHGDAHTDHLAQLTDGRWVTWSHMVTCYCEEGDDCECFEYEFIEDKQASDILKKGSVNITMRLRG